jgi:hypothetical protein
MIYLIGGAARAGKTLITQRLWREKQVPYFCIDYFQSAIDQGAPELGIQAESHNLVRAPALWPRIEYLFRNIIEVEPDYTIEGDALWPRGASLMIQDYTARRIRAVFLGYAHTTPQRKLADIRANPGGVNDWIQRHDDTYILALAQEMIEFSEFLEAECPTLGLPYIDVSECFADRIEQAYQLLTDS